MQAIPWIMWEDAVIRRKCHPGPVSLDDLVCSFLFITSLYAWLFCSYSGAECAGWLCLRAQRQRRTVIRLFCNIRYCTLLSFYSLLLLLFITHTPRYIHAFHLSCSIFPFLQLSLSLPHTHAHTHSYSALWSTFHHSSVSFPGAELHLQVQHCTPQLLRKSQSPVF